MEEKLVLYERKENVGIITLNRPKSLNAITDPLLMDLKTAMDAARADKEARVFIFKGEGRAFCAGADTKEAVSFASPEEHAEHYESMGQLMMSIMDIGGRPVIAQIQGYAVGGGLELALYCDLRIAAEDAKLGFAETRVGATTAISATYILPRIIGLAKAKELLLVSEFIDGKEAERIGMVNKAVPLEDLERVTWELAKKIAGNYPLEVRLAKGAIDRGMDSNLLNAYKASRADGRESYRAGARRRGMAEARETAKK